jgi:hypothetical protein
MGSKHTYITQDEWLEIKAFLNHTGRTRREVAFRFNRSDQAIRQVNETHSFNEYREKYQGRRYPHQQFIPLKKDECPQCQIDEIKERLDRIETQLKAINYIWEK